jgi:hypothetical protein
MSKSVEQTRRELFKEWFDSLVWPMCEKCSKSEYIAWEAFNAALDAVETLGYRIVPVTPTEKMLNSVTTSKHPILRKEVMRMVAEDYKLMLDNAPDYLGLKIK